MNGFCLLFIPLKRPKIVFFGLQKHCFCNSGDDVLPPKTYSFATQKHRYYKIDDKRL